MQHTDNNTEIDLERAAAHILSQKAKQKELAIQSISTALVLGSGLGEVMDGFQIALQISYVDIPGMPISTAPEHAGVFKLVQAGSELIALFQGRFHLYEGYEPKAAASTSYLSQRLGAKRIIFLNAAGGLNPDFQPGDIMLVEDHLNFTGHSPLRGANDETIGVRFPDMSQAYTPALRKLAIKSAEQTDVSIRQGIYAGVKGPELETSAERRYLHSAGGDAVGMSLVMETIGAAHCGLEVLALCAITNVATGGADQQVDTIEDVLKNAAVAADKLAVLVPAVLAGFE